MLLLALLVGLSVADNVPRVKTPNGVVVGHYKTSYNGRKFTAFEGIPYAKKPIGALRFEVKELTNKAKSFLKFRVLGAATSRTLVRGVTCE